MIAESHCVPGAGHTGLPRVPINRISCLDLFQRPVEMPSFTQT